MQEILDLFKGENVKGLIREELQYKTQDLRQFVCFCKTQLKGR